MKRQILYWVGGAAAVFLLMLVSWMAVETGIEISSRATFCNVCHSMVPMVDSYRDNSHGGNNPRGITAACTDCHVTHESLFRHFLGKAKSGTHDIWVTLTTDEMSQDWQAKRAEHNEYVYDSGCLTCHQELESVTQNQEEHNNYFNDVIDSQCVDCHEEIGHSNLNKYLLETKYRYGE